MVFQTYAIWPHMTVFENIAFPLRAKRVPAAEIRDRVMAILETHRARGLRGPPGAAALGWPAAARGAGARARGRPGRAAPRRAVLQSRCAAARGDALRAEGAAGAGRRHDALRHPRSGGGHDPVRPRARDERRADRPGRHAASRSTRSRARASSWTFWVRSITSTRGSRARPDGAYVAVVEGVDGRPGAAAVRTRPGRTGDDAVLAFRSVDVRVHPRRSRRNWPGVDRVRRLPGRACPVRHQAGAGAGARRRGRRPSRSSKGTPRAGADPHAARSARGRPADRPRA